MMKNVSLRTITYLHDFFISYKNRQLDPENPRILIVSTTGIGDTLWATPSIRAIKKTFPKAYLAFLTNPNGKAVLEENPHLDEIFVIKNPAFFPCCRLLAHLRQKRFDTALLFHISQRPLLPFLHLLQVEKIIGTKGMNKGLDHYLTHPLNNKKEHEMKRRFALTSLLGVKEFFPEMEVFLKKEEEERVHSRILSHFSEISSPLIGMHPGSQDRFKCWNPSYFCEVGRRIVREKKGRIVITGDQKEAPLAEKIASQIPGALSLAGKCSLRDTMALIKACDLFLANDTGPLYISHAVKTKTVGLFAPSDSKLCALHNLPHIHIIQKERTCFPCLRKKCQLPFCLEQIPPEEVFEKIKVLLHKGEKEIVFTSL